MVGRAVFETKESPKETQESPRLRLLPPVVCCWISAGPGIATVISDRSIRNETNEEKEMLKVSINPSFPVLVRRLLVLLALIRLEPAALAQWEYRGDGIFNTLSLAEDIPIAINFHSLPNYYAIYRTPGPWVSPSYQQLMIRFPTGIVLQPGEDDSAS